MNTNENRPPMGSRRGGRSGRKNTNGHTQRNTQSERGQYVYSADGRHPTGVIDGDTFRRYADSAKGHMMRTPPGWALETQTLETLNARAVSRIVLTDEATGKIYEATPADFTRFGLKRDYGYGAQVCLPLPYWSVDGQPPKAAEARPPAAEQLSLW